MSQDSRATDGLHLLMLEHHQLEELYRAWRDSAALHLPLSSIPAAPRLPEAAPIPI